MYYDYKYDIAGYVRAFLKVSPLDISGISPESAANGVYVYANNGKLYNPDNWNTANNDNAVGVAVITDNSRFCIKKGLANSDGDQSWSVNLSVTDVSELTNYTSSATARTDYNGQSNTATIRAASPSEISPSFNAAHWCYSQAITVNGELINGYLPAMGELYDIYNNKSTIENTLSLIGSKTIASLYSDGDPFLWSSTEYGSDYAWGLTWGIGNIYNYDKGTTYDYYYTIPCFPLQVLQDLLGLPAPEGSADYETSTITFEKASIPGAAGAIKLTSDQDWMIRLNPEFPILQSGTYEFCYLDPSNPNNHGQITNQAIILPVTPNN